MFWKLISTCSEELFEKILFFENFRNCNIFFGLWAEKFLTGVLKTAFFVFRVFFLGFSSTFENFGDFIRKIFDKFVGIAFYVSRETFWEEVEKRL